MAITIQETFRVDAPVERVWGFLLDPHQVVQCLPGAELLEAQDERTFLGRVSVKVGPITASYKGRAELTEIDEQQHRVRMAGEGQDTKGAGSARMTMTSRITAADDGGAEVSVESEVQLVGKLAQFGRGMVEEVSRQLFRQFAGCVRQRLEAVGETAGGDPGGGGGAASAASGPKGSAPSGGSGAATAEPGPARAVSVPAGSAPAAPAPPQAARTVSILPLLFRALKARIARFFGRTAT